MEKIFIHVLNYSISATWVILAVIILRLIIKRMPKWISCTLWSLAALRLIIPRFVQSAVSLIPNTYTVPDTIMLDRNPQIDTGVNIINSIINPAITKSFAPNPIASANPLQIIIFFASIIWIIGLCCLIFYMAVNWVILRHRLAFAVKLKDNIYQSENITTPFLFGIFKPKIYIPFNTPKCHIDNIAAHENMHIKRKDHILKPLAFILLSVYWFNPFIWAAYILYCKDTELACDEKAVKSMSEEKRKSYSLSLLHFGSCKTKAGIYPLGFCETGIKSRIKNIIRYKRPRVFISVLGAVILLALSACFLTDPQQMTDISDTQHAQDQASGQKIYVYQQSQETVKPYLALKENNEFVFFYSALSSYYATGEYSITDDTLICKTYDGKYTYTFQTDGQCYIFDKDRSSSIPSLNISDGDKTNLEECVPDNAVFS